MGNKFWKLFSVKKPIIGMIHLAEDDVKRALNELAVYREHGINGAIIENYHGNIISVEKTLKETKKLETGLIIGVNILPNEYPAAFDMAKEFKARFIQLDYVSGFYKPLTSIDSESYQKYRKAYEDIVVLGGVWPKYYEPTCGSDLEKDLKEGMENADAIVVTGVKTGSQTPIEKIKRFRKVLGSFPLIIGAGLNPKNAYEQLSIADGAIVGSSFKINNLTHNAVDPNKIKDFMQVVEELRNN